VDHRVRPIAPGQDIEKGDGNDRTITHLYAFEISLEASKVTGEPI